MGNPFRGVRRSYRRITPLWLRLTSFFAFPSIGRREMNNLWFHAEAHRAKDEFQLHRADSEDAIWFVALAKEQLTLIADYGLHGISFVEG